MIFNFFLKARLFRINCWLLVLCYANVITACCPRRTQVAPIHVEVQLAVITQPEVDQHLAIGVAEAVMPVARRDGAVARRDRIEHDHFQRAIVAHQASEILSERRAAVATQVPFGRFSDTSLASAASAPPVVILAAQLVPRLRRYPAF